MKKYIELFTAFFKTGLFTFGGGYAMLPLLKAEVCEKHKWISEDELLDYFSIGQCTPGIIAINVSTFCGYKLYGIKGAVISTTAMVLPSLIIIIVIAAALSRYMQIPVIANAFAGIRLGVTALLLNLIFNTGCKVFKESQHRYLHAFIFIMALILLLFGGVSAVFIVLMAAFCGFLPDLIPAKIKNFFRGENK